MFNIESVDMSAARHDLIHGPVPVRGPGVAEHCPSGQDNGLMAVSSSLEPPCRGAMHVKSVERSNAVWNDEAHFWLNGYVNKQNCRIWSEANPQVYVETPLHPEKLTVWYALWAGGILLQKR
ncbi:hypothetical protein TNCV_2385831 [Trichonephila clavipes]|nr:hypothetical protein TNCV_2385831 [Trichonephila clavipes]